MGRGLAQCWSQQEVGLASHSSSITYRQLSAHLGTCKGPRFSGLLTPEQRVRAHFLEHTGDDLISSPTASHLDRGFNHFSCLAANLSQSGKFHFLISGLGGNQKCPEPQR